MKKILLALAALSLTPACETIPTSPNQVADLTQRDEQAVIAVELAYRAARTAVEIGVDAGVIRGANATRFRTLNQQAYAAVQASRTAYRAGNASSYAVAIGQAQSLVAQMLSLTGRN